MSNSRRGLLAAGLAAAVVGSMGVVWTLNANAAETPESETVAVAEAQVADASSEEPAAQEPVAEETVAAEEPAAGEPAAQEPAAGEPVAVPPELLPWGAEPTELTRAPAGASSAVVAAVGADAAPADTSGSMVPEPEFAPKGFTSQTKSLKTMQTTIVPPAPPAITPQAAAAAPARDVFFHYAEGTQIAESDGTWANLTIEKPNLVEGDYHTLAELAVRSADTQQTVEVGWNVDRSVNGDNDPHLFVFYWKDGQRTCYNACGFTMYSKTVKPGDTLPVGTQKRFGIQHSGNAWWIAYDSEWIGYFPDKNWDSKFTKAGVTQWFGEVASATATPCTQMGNGRVAGDGLAARIGSISLTNGPAVKFEPRASSSMYSVNVRSDTTFRYGGPYYPPIDPEDPTSPPVVKC